MNAQADRIRETLQRAADSGDGNVQEQLRSLDEGFMEIVEGEKTKDTPPHDDRLAELEEKLAGLIQETDGETRRLIREAETLIGDYRTGLEE